MTGGDDSPGSWVHVFTPRERVLSAVEVLRDPHGVDYVATLADVTPEATEVILERLEGEGLVREEDGEYDVDDAALARFRDENATVPNPPSDAGDVSDRRRREVGLSHESDPDAPY